MDEDTAMSGMSGMNGRSWLMPAPAPTTPGEELLQQTCVQTPLIDHHAHPLLYSDHAPPARTTVLQLTSQAQGPALANAQYTLAHRRGLQQLAAALSLQQAAGPKTTTAELLDRVSAAIERQRSNRLAHDRWAATCTKGIGALLLDDGLDLHQADTVLDVAEMKAITGIPVCRRIFRIEAEAERLWERMLLIRDENAPAPGLDVWTQEFHKMIDAAMRDPNVAAFKSVVGYRAGLDIPAHYNEDDGNCGDCGCLQGQVRHGFQVDTTTECWGMINGTMQRKPFRIKSVALSHWVVFHAADRIILAARQMGVSPKPLQFHTGVGDQDLVLAKASPALLKPFISNRADLPVVLLHTGYPHQCDAAWLAAMYQNVYVDISGLCPLSTTGIDRVLNDLLELCPWNKIMACTDGHHSPETFLLAQHQLRLSLDTVLYRAVMDRCRTEITWEEAAAAARGILFDNANALYGLQLTAPDLVLPSRPRAGIADPGIGCDCDTTLGKNYRLLRLLDLNPEAGWISIAWIDYTGVSREKMITEAYARTLCGRGGGSALTIGVTKASLGLLQSDAPAPGVMPTGEYRLSPDPTWVKRTPDGVFYLFGDLLEPGPAPAELGSDAGSACGGGSAPVNRSRLCPRTTLQRVIDTAWRQYGLLFRIGFELELVLLKVDPDSTATGASRYTKLGGSGAHAWASSRAMRTYPEVQTVLRRAVAHMIDNKVMVEQMHAENAPGQFEVVLPHAPPMEAVQNLLYARQVIAEFARRQHCIITLHPKPFANACGTAAHAHISISSAGGDNPAVYEPFWAGVLSRLPAVSALTLSGPASWDRVMDGAWAGGRWAAWGTQNRETPLRKIADSHWEFKALDGVANMFLATAAILGAGMLGVRGNEALACNDLQVDPASLTESERAAHGVLAKLPDNTSSALEALLMQQDLCHVLGADLVKLYTTVKMAEVKSWDEMDPDKRWQWMVEHY